MGWWRRLSSLQIALLVSFGVHAALLTVRFIDPEGFERVFQDTPLEVILVNARSNERILAGLSRGTPAACTAANASSRTNPCELGGLVSSCTSS